jgi:hypothetical protein
VICQLSDKKPASKLAFRLTLVSASRLVWAHDT